MCDGAEVQMNDEHMAELTENLHQIRDNGHRK